MSIGLLYERSENDETGIKLTAEEMGAELTYIPFRKVAVTIGNNTFSVRSKGKKYTDIIKNLSVVLNRAQSKNRRLYAAYLMEKFGKKVVNSSQIEFRCYSKIRILTDFWAIGIPIPRTSYVPCDPTDTIKGGREIHNESDIADLLQQEISNTGIVLKPDAGTHGNMIMLAKNREELVMDIHEMKPSIINPVGIVAQELVQKWFYDLRIIIYKEKGKDPVCHPVALARAGFKDFRTNTYLGNLVFDAKLPGNIKGLAVRCGEALGRNNEAWVFALDAMMNIGNNKTANEEDLKKQLEKATVEFEIIKKVKKDETRLTDFPNWNKKLEEAFKNFMNTEHYAKIKTAIEESVEKNKQNIVFHEANSCPEFWEQTRLIAGINVAIPLIKCAQSII
jgi:glutathione synthase/RimK-type ligase-like ATP-grasp enzyme